MVLKVDNVSVLSVERGEIQLENCGEAMTVVWWHVELQNSPRFFGSCVLSLHLHTLKGAMPEIICLYMEPFNFLM